jgi:hypothetical protein
MKAGWMIHEVGWTRHVPISLLFIPIFSSSAWSKFGASLDFELSWRACSDWDGR